MRTAVRASVHLLVSLSVTLPAARMAAQGEPRLGTIQFPTTGAPNAQPLFYRGVLYLHSFEYDSAAKAFRQAQQVDPAFALAYWGEAMTYTHPVWFQQDLAAARTALARYGPDRVTRLRRITDARERRWFETAEVLYGDGGKELRDTLFAEAMGRLVHDYPTDREAFMPIPIIRVPSTTSSTATMIRSMRR
jgi:tetratricopeptide (TPR) repeat protein